LRVRLSMAGRRHPADFHLVIPLTWDDDAITTLKVPNGRRNYSWRFVSADY